MCRNELLTILWALDAVVTRTVALMATDVKTRKLVGINRETVEECLKSFQIAAKVLSKKKKKAGNGG